MHTHISSRKLPSPTLAALAVSLGMTLGASAQMTFFPTQKSYDFEGSAGGRQSLTYPTLKTSGGAALSPQSVATSGTEALVTYADGTKLKMYPNGEHGIQLHFTSIGADTSQMEMRIVFPASIRQLKFADGNGAAKAFPATVPENGVLVNGDGKTIRFENAAGKGFVLGVPYGWTELRDARIWNNNREVFWFTSTNLPKNNGEGFYQLTLRDSAAPKKPQAVAESVKPAPKPAPAKNAFGISLYDWGVKISVGEGGTYDMKYPTFGQDGLKDPKVTVDSGTRATLAYPGGAKAVATMEGGTFKMQFSGLPGGELRARTEMYVPINFAGNGTFAMDGTRKEFPREKAPNGKVFQGNASAFTLTHATGMGFTMSGFNNAFQEVQDNREWNWPIFMWMVHVSIYANNGNASLQWQIAQAGSDRPNVLVDRFGQWVKSDFPTKVKSDQDLKDDRAADAKYYASLTPPKRDAYGGLPGSKQQYGLKATGFFRLDKVNGADVLVTPEGNVFFHLGVCGIMPLDEYTTVDKRESIYEHIPKHEPEFASAFRDGHKVFPSFHLINYIKKTGIAYEPKSYLRVWIERLRKWGFNSGGAWAYQGDVGDVLKEQKFPGVEFLNFGSVAWFPDNVGVFDPFAPGAEKAVDDALARTGARRANDPLVIGWFLANEPHIENLPKVLLRLDGKWHAKRKFVDGLRAKYTTIDAFNAAWDMQAASFDALVDAALTLKTRRAGDDTEAFFRVVLREYFRIVNTAFRKHLPNHLLIGHRLMPGTANSQTLIEESGRVLDIVTVNYYTYGVDKDFLARLHTWSGGRPMIFSEFYYTSGEQSLPGGMRMATDRERGLAYRNFVEQSVATGCVVGIEWFIAVDQATTGRFFQGFNGEANNTGLVNVADRPYKAMLEEMMKTNYGIYDVLLRRRNAYAFNDPRFTGERGSGARKSVAAPRLTKPFTLDGARTEWPGVPAEIIGKEGLVHGMNADGFEATFHVAWDDQNLYVFADVQDPTPMKNDEKGAWIWNGDGIELFIGYDQLDQGGALKYCDRQVLLRAAPPFGADASAIVNGDAKAPVRLIAVPAANGKGYSLEAAIPFANLGFAPKQDMTLLFDLAIDDSATGKGRTRQSVWNGSAQNSKDRSVWGHLKLVP